MTRAIRSKRHHPVDDPEGDPPPAVVTAINRAGAAPRTHDGPTRLVQHRGLTPIVHLPVTPAIVLAPAAPRVVAEANVQVKRFHDGLAEDDRYTATLDAASDAPAALLAALADAATRIEDLVSARAPDDHVIMTISIRR